MKITINSKNLLTAVQKVGACIKTNNTLPILQCVLLSSSKNKLFLKASNLEITANTEVMATIEGSVHTCINYDMLSSILKNMPSAPLELEFLDKKVNLTCEASKYELPLFEAKAFPNPEEVEFTDTLELDNVAFTNAIAKAVKFVGDDPMQPWIETVLVHGNGENICIVANDRNKMFLEKIGTTKEEFKLLIHHRSIPYLMTQPLTEEKITLSFTKSMIKLKDTDTEIGVLLTDATYVNYQALIDSLKIKDTSDKTILRVNKTNLVRTIQKLSPIYNNIEYKNIKLNLLPTETIITSDNDFMNQKGREVLPAVLEGNEMIIGFDVRNFNMAVKAIEDEEIAISFTAPNRPVTINTERIFTLAMPWG